MAHSPRSHLHLRIPQARSELQDALLYFQAALCMSRAHSQGALHRLMRPLTRRAAHRHQVGTAEHALAHLVGRRIPRAPAGALPPRAAGRVGARAAQELRKGLGNTIPLHRALALRRPLPIAPCGSLQGSAGSAAASDSALLDARRLNELLRDLGADLRCAALAGPLITAPADIAQHQTRSCCAHARLSRCRVFVCRALSTPSPVARRARRARAAERADALLLAAESLMLEGARALAAGGRSAPCSPLGQWRLGGAAHAPPATRARGKRMLFGHETAVGHETAEATLICRISPQTACTAACSSVPCVSYSFSSSMSPASCRCARRALCGPACAMQLASGEPSRAAPARAPRQRCPRAAKPRLHALSLAQWGCTRPRRARQRRRPAPAGRSLAQAVAASGRGRQGCHRVRILRQEILWRSCHPHLGGARPPRRQGTVIGLGSGPARASARPARSGGRRQHLAARRPATEASIRTGCASTPALAGPCAAGVCRVGHRECRRQHGRPASGRPRATASSGARWGVRSRSRAPGKPGRSRGEAANPRA